MKRSVLYMLVGWMLVACTPREQEKEIVKENVTVRRGGGKLVRGDNSFVRNQGHFEKIFDI